MTSFLAHFFSSCLLVFITYFISFNFLYADTSTGLVAWWKLDDGSGISATDSAGTNTGTLNGAGGLPTWTTGKRDGGLLFDGGDDYVQVADSNSLDITNAFSFSMWMKPTVLTTSNRYLMGKKNTAGADNAYAVIWEYSNNNVQFYKEGSPVGYPAANTNITVADTEWHHIVYTYDGATFSGYLDGASAFTPVSVSFSCTASTGLLFLGNFNTGNFTFSGTLDDVRIYNRALTAVDVLQLYAGNALLRGMVINGATINAQ